MADNFNINTTQEQANEAQGLLPNGQNFGSAIAANTLAQQQQEQLVQQAIERTKQAKMQTGVEEKGGLEAEKGLVPKAQALTDLRAAAETSNIDDDKKAAIIKDAEENWPELVNQDAIHRLTNALRPARPVKMAEGQPFQATGDEKDANEKPFAKGTWIQESVDDNGNQTFVHSNQPPSVQAAAAKGGQADKKELKEFGKEIDGMVKTRFGATGMLATKIVRADSALNTLARPELTKQDLENVSTDIAAIYQGGVPGSMQIVENSYGTTLTNLMETIRHYTGVLKFFGNQTVLSDTKVKLTQVLTDMRNSALATLEQIFKGVAKHYPDLDPESPEVMEVIQGTMDGLKAGLINEKGEILPPTGALPQAGGNASHAPAAGAAPQGEARKTSSGISYTVS